jgi:hypothetical protein
MENEPQPSTMLKAKKGLWIKIVVCVLLEII